ncbi:MAG: glycogen synthase [Planctomycetaceae bacterium]|jgi:starch synthase|nr:glycogen synthase [Planctomycetaceae bacterium]
MRILFATSEATPFAKTGGLADVSASLPRVLGEQGHDICVFMPLYKSVFNSGLPLRNMGFDLSIPIRNKTVFGTVWEGRIPGSPNVPFYFVQQDDYFDRDGIYSQHGTDYEDNCERFVFFCRSVMESIERLWLDIDILHSNDWQTGLLPAYLRLMYGSRPRFQRVASVHTIHNLAYQGVFWHWDMKLTGIGWEHFRYDELEFYGKLNFLKAGLTFCDAITTVSPRYAVEIQTEGFGCGMNDVLAYRCDRLFGILNGISKEWNPSTDNNLAVTYSSEDVFEKKPVCKQALQAEMNLPQRRDLPLIGIVGRLAFQKGIDLVCDVIPTWVENHNVQFVILGTGDTALETRLSELAAKYPKNVAVRSEFCDPIAHRIEAGADLFLMPSRYEPCGLNQMYSQIYGTLPIVHDTGGLADTVTDEETGFSFNNDNIDELNKTIWRALDKFWHQPARFQEMIQQAMKLDWSWQRSAEQYASVYDKVKRK